MSIVLMACSRNVDKNKKAEVEYDSIKSIETSSNEVIDIDPELDIDYNIDYASDEYIESLKLTGYDDPKYIEYYECMMYDSIDKSLDPDKYVIQSIDTYYYSKEYLETLDFNSKENVFWGYKLSELDEVFQGQKYVFSMDEDGNTTVTEYKEQEEDGKFSSVFGSVLKNVAIGAGIIVTVVVLKDIAAGTCVATFITKYALKPTIAYARDFALVNGVTTAVITGFETKDFKTALEATALAASEGLMIGAIVGTASGLIRGTGTELLALTKFRAPYSPKIARYDQTPKSGEAGTWTGKRGESNFVLNTPITTKSGVTITECNYINGMPDFSPYAKATVDITGMTTSRASNYNLADQVLASKWTNTAKTWTAADVKAYRESLGLTWHEMNNMKTMQLVPTEVNSTFKHLGGVSEINFMNKYLSK